MAAAMNEPPDKPHYRGSCLKISCIVIVCLTMVVVILFSGRLGMLTMLRDAAAKGDIRQVQMLLKFGAGRWAINSTNMYGYGPMQLAAQNGHADVLSLLVENGGNVNLRRPSSQNTPLIMAASRGHVDCCQLLLDKGADPNAYGMFGGTRHTALQSASGGGRLEVVNFFLERGIGPNEKQGSTSALHCACKDNHIDVVKALVSAGADVTSIQEWKWNTPLQFATKHGRSEIAAFLKQVITSEEERQREIERQLFENIEATVEESNKELVLEAYIPNSARFVVDSNGIHWESRLGGKPGTHFGKKMNEPTYINGIAWYPRWSSGLYEKDPDQSESCPVRISLESVRFELLGVGESRDSYTIKSCPRIKTFKYPDREFAVLLSGTEIHFRWCRFRLSW